MAKAKKFPATVFAKYEEGGDKPYLSAGELAYLVEDEPTVIAEYKLVQVFKAHKRVEIVQG